jgi:Holliday junction resolvasome RuvABC endonuclease subunit
MTATTTAAPTTGAAAPPPRVVGLDLSITATGIARSDGTLTTVNTKTATSDQRLLVIERHVAEVIGVCHEYPKPHLAVIEDLPTHAHGAGITGMVHGVIRVVLMRSGIPYVLVPPATLKKYATGKGNATKPDMRMALYQRAGLDLRDDNQVDALWLRLMGLDALGHPQIDLPKAQRDALAKVAWPATATA